MSLFQGKGVNDRVSQSNVESNIELLHQSRTKAEMKSFNTNSF